MQLRPEKRGKEKHVTCTSCTVCGKPLWCVSYDPHTELMFKLAQAHTFPHTNITPSMSLAAPWWTPPLQSLTSPSSAISFVFGQMQCNGPGGSNTLYGAITQKQSVTTQPEFKFFFSSLLCTLTISQDLSTAGCPLLILLFWKRIKKRKTEKLVTLNVTLCFRPIYQILLRV